MNIRIGISLVFEAVGWSFSKRVMRPKEKRYSGNAVFEMFGYQERFGLELKATHIIMVKEEEVGRRYI